MKVCGALWLLLWILWLAPALAEEPSAAEATPSPWTATVYEPTCTGVGYTLCEDPENGVTFIRDEVPALGHRFGEWETDPEAHVIRRVCLVCGETEEFRLIEGVPEIRLSGELSEVGKRERVTVALDWVEEHYSLSVWASTTWQGHTSMIYPKKNYTIRLFDESFLIHKHSMVLRPGWQLEHKYILKASYEDVTHARNVVCARLWGMAAASREHLHERLRGLSNYGAVDGFPVTLWINDAFTGLYTLCLHKDNSLFGMEDEGRMDAVMICNSERRDEALFEERASFDEEGDWELEFCATEDHTWAEASFNALIDFLNETDDETFRARLGEHLDVEAAIDYLVFMYAAGLNHSYAKDLVMVSYDGGPWIASVYDMEDAFGLSTDGSWADEPSEYLPELEDGEWNSGTGSVLWDRLLRNFLPEIAARYRALRQGPLSEETMCAMIVDFRAGIPEEWFALDLETYPDREPLEDPYGQILQYIPQRLALLDEIWGGQ